MKRLPFKMNHTVTHFYNPLISFWLLKVFEFKSMLCSVNFISLSFLLYINLCWGRGDVI